MPGCLLMLSLRCCALFLSKGKKKKSRILLLMRHKSPISHPVIKCCKRLVSYLKHDTSYFIVHEDKKREGLSITQVEGKNISVDQHETEFILCFCIGFLRLRAMRLLCGNWSCLFL